MLMKEFELQPKYVKVVKSPVLFGLLNTILEIFWINLYTFKHTYIWNTQIQKQELLFLSFVNTENCEPSFFTPPKISRLHFCCHVRWSTDISFPFLQAIVISLSFRTDRSGQTVQTQIRLLLEEQSDQGLYCLKLTLHLLDALLYGNAILFDF